MRSNTWRMQNYAYVIMCAPLLCCYSRSPSFSFLNTWYHSSVSATVIPHRFNTQQNISHSVNKICTCKDPWVRGKGSQSNEITGWKGPLTGRMSIYKPSLNKVQWVVEKTRIVPINPWVIFHFITWEWKPKMAKYSIYDKDRQSRRTLTQRVIDCGRASER